MDAIALKKPTMSNAHFVSRESCPGCRSTDAKTIYQKPFDQPPVSVYLNDFYSTCGKVEFEYLEGSNYILNECNNCGMIYQKEIPGDALEYLYCNLMGIRTSFNPAILPIFTIDSLR